MFTKHLGLNTESERKVGKITVKLSHSILSAWAKGQSEQAIGYYLGKDLPASDAMELGKLNHEIWERYITKNKSLPVELGGGKLRDPITEQKYRKLIPFSDNYQILISGVLDLEDDNVITDFKCGRSEATSYTDSFQMDYYKLLRPDAKTGVYRCWNPYLKKLTIGIRFLSDKDAERALEHIITFGGEMILYLASQKLLVDYKGTI